MASAWRACSRFEFISSCAETMSPRRFRPCELRVWRIVSRLWVAAVARLEVSSTSCSTAWTDSFPESVASLLPAELAIDEPWSAFELTLDFPFFPLLFALGGALVAIEEEPPDVAPLDDVLASEDGRVPVLAEGGIVPASAGGGVEVSEGFAESGVVFPAGVPELAFGVAPLASADGVVGGVGVWAEF